MMHHLMKSISYNAIGAEGPNHAIAPVSFTITMEISPVW